MEEANRKKILFITSRVPYPLDKGDKLRAYYMIKHLAENYDVHLFSISHNTVSIDQKNAINGLVNKAYFFKINSSTYIKNLFKSIFSKQPFQVAYFYSDNAKYEIEKITKTENYDVVIAQLIRTAEYAKNLPVKLKILDMMDALSKGIERRMPYENLFMKLVLKSESKRLKRYESAVSKNFKFCLIISEQDKNLLPQSAAEKTMVIVNGVDAEKFKPTSAKKIYDICFCGNMSYPPNIQAAIFLCTKILPLLKIHHPGIKIVLAGTSPTAEVRNLESDNVIVTGWVDKIQSIYDVSKIFVAPLFIGTGLQNKILEAMAMELPVITTPLAKDALLLPQNNIPITVKTPQEFDHEIIKLLSQETLRKEIGIQSRNYVTQNYSWDKSNELLKKMVES